MDFSEHMPHNGREHRAVSGTGARRALFFLREYWFPSGCAFCGAALGTAAEAWYGLCESCRAVIAEEWAEDRGGAGERRDHCDCCGKPLISEQGRCLPCRNAEKPAYDRVIALFPYTGKYRRLLRSYKFGQNLALGNFFAEKIRETLGEFNFPEAAIVPVPPRPGKIKHSGWDQVEYLVRLLEKGRGAAVSRCLKRLPSKIQKELNREDRKANLRGRIALQTPAPKTAILIDDVMTTGSTMEVCAGVLKAGGAERVYGICLLYNV